MIFTIEFFTLDDGSKPVSEFLDSVDEKMKVKILDNLNHLKNNGYMLREPYSKPLKDGIFELRTQTHRDIGKTINSNECYTFRKNFSITARSKTNSRERKSREFVKFRVQTKNETNFYQEKF